MIFPALSTSITLTFNFSPTRAKSLALFKYSLDNLETWHNPSLSPNKETNTPYSSTLVITPSKISPTSTSLVIPSIMSLAFKIESLSV